MRLTRSLLCFLLTLAVAAVPFAVSAASPAAAVGLVESGTPDSRLSIIYDACAVYSSDPPGYAAPGDGFVPPCLVGRPASGYIHDPAATIVFRVRAVHRYDASSGVVGPREVPATCWLPDADPVGSPGFRGNAPVSVTGHLVSAPWSQPVQTYPYPYTYEQETWCYFTARRTAPLSAHGDILLATGGISVSAETRPGPFGPDVVLHGVGSLPTEQAGQPYVQWAGLPFSAPNEPDYSNDGQPVTVKLTCKHQVSRNTCRITRKAPARIRITNRDQYQRQWYSLRDGRNFYHAPPRNGVLVVPSTKRATEVKRNTTKVVTIRPRRTGKQTLTVMAEGVIKRYTFWARK